MPTIERPATFTACGGLRESTTWPRCRHARLAGTSRSRGFELQLSGHTHGGPIVVNALLDADARWARARPDVVAIALVGSHTRGTTHAESDVDLDLVVDDPARFLASDDWLHAFGDVHIAGDERYGAVTSRCAF